MKIFDYFKEIIKNWKSKLKNTFLNFSNDLSVFKRKNLLEILKVVNKLASQDLHLM